jgi:hypothetical protein
MNVVWSDHSLQRFFERDGTSAPIEKIKRAGRLVDIDEEFHCSNLLHTFVCKRVSEIGIVIVTTMLNVGNKRPQTQQNRIYNKREQRLQRRKEMKYDYSERGI